MRIASHIARLGAVALLLWALAPHPYAYYTLLRWVVCAVAAYSAVEAYEQGRRGLTWTLIVTALLFNPLLPVHLDRTTWAGVDIATAVLFGSATVLLIGSARPARSARD